ncbi:hypothetical protein BFP71_01430 [Roseivirga misakiensis]|uniref:DUF3078 domain-containing protein n=1 Tax=Roseivirga misakiensis TaxID=1563681 RepID=A0A1E5T756_9BACT|nr:hypothetical protein BFP71_01430 [Roseivirga misakiensis]
MYWKDGGRFNLNIQQVGLTNWAAGGESSVAIGAAVEGFVNYEKDDVVWENKGRIAYGVIRNGGGGNRFEKTNDVVDFSSKYSQKFSEKVLLTSAVNFRTQMDNGVKIENIAGTSDTRRILISDFMSPGYLQASLGLTYRETKKGYSVTLAPFTGRFTFVLNDSLSNVGSFGVEAGETIRSEAGISLTGGVQRDVMENVKLQMNFNLFSNYDKFPNTVVNVEAGLNLKVNDYIQSNISSQIIYDDDVIITRSDGSRGRDLQIKNVINVGFTLGF